MSEAEPNPYLVVVFSSSAGGIEALSRLVWTIPESFTAPVVIAQHLDPGRESRPQEILARRSTPPVRTVTDHETPEPGVVYVVPADRHVNVTDHEIDLDVDGPRRPKPSVDLLMKSAAGVFGERLIAVVLTGTGSDGAEGARVVRGGERFLMPTAVAQAPAPTATRARQEGRTLASVGFAGEMRPSERRSRVADDDLLNALPVGVVVVDRRYDVQTMNAAARRLLSIRGAAVGEDLLHAAHGVPYGEVRDAIDAAFRDGTATTGEFSVEDAATGEPRYLQLACHPQRSGAGGRTLAETVAVVVKDVTDIGRERRELTERPEEPRKESGRIAAEEAQATIEELNTTNGDLQARTAELRNLARVREGERRASESSRRRLEAILSGMSDAVLAGDADGRVLFSNGVFTETFGDGEPGQRDAGPRLGRVVPLGEGGGGLAEDDLPQKRTVRGESFGMRFAVSEGGSLEVFEARGRPIDGADVGGGCS